MKKFAAAKNQMIKKPREERAKRTIVSVTRRKAWLALEQPPENTEDAKDVKDPAYAWEDEDDVLGS